MQTQQSWLIGSAPHCDLVVPHETVSGRHCRLTRSPAGYVLDDLGSTNGTWVNGVRISKTVPVTPTDKITIGLAVALPWPDDHHGGNGIEARPGRVIKIGGAADNDFVLRDPVVSQHHAQIVIDAGGAFLEDLGSTNGTFLGSHDRRISRAPITEADTLYFGSVGVPARRLLGGFEVEAPAAPRVQTQAAPHDQTLAARTLSYAGGVMVIGRDPACDRVIDMPTISGRHARLSRSGSSILIEDLGSGNGTFVNGRKVEGPTPTVPGDRIGLGTFLLTLVEAGPTGRQTADGPRGGAGARTNGDPGRRLHAAPHKTVRIFVSSPGDVAEERFITERVIQRVADRYADDLALEPVFWEHEPLLATDTFQAQITRPSETDIFICVLWSRLGTRLPASIRRPDGTNYQSGTEFEFEDALNSYRQRKTPDLIVYRKMSEPEPLRMTDLGAARERLRQRELLEEFVQRWFHGSDGSLTAAFHGYKESSEFEENVEMHLAKLVARKAKEAGRRDVESAPVVARAAWGKGSPFRGLESFEFEHEPIFFGRTRSISAALRLLREQAAAGRPFLLVVASSGSGKSSLVRAGLLPMLTRPGVVPDVAAWRRAVLRPSDGAGDLFLGLATALLLPSAFPELAATQPAEKLASLLRDQPRQALNLIETALKQSLVPTRLVVVIDQMEELFSLEQVSDEARTAFCRLVEELCKRGVWVVATLRSDFYHRCVAVPELARLKGSRGQFDLQPPTPSEIAAIIRQPAAAAGLIFERNPQTQEPLDEMLCDAASRNPESLPLLEFTLNELYERRSGGNVLTLEAYQNLGGLEGALATRAEEVLGQLPAEVRARLSRVFRQLVTVGEGDGATVTRRPAPLAELTKDPQSTAFVVAFVQARLIVTNQGNDGVPLAEIVHEALMTRWEPLRQAIAADRELLRIRSRVSSAGRIWVESRRSADRLLAEGQPLNEAKRLLKAGFELSSVESALIAASDSRARLRRRARLVSVSILAVVSAVALVACGFAVHAGNRARHFFDRSRGIIDEFVTGIAQEGLKDAPGLQDKRKEFANLAVGHFEEFIGEYPDDPEVRTGLARARTSLARIVGDIGSLDEAVALLKEAISAQEKTVRANPDIPKYRLQLARSLRELGTLYWEVDRNGDAKPQIENAIKVLDELSAQLSVPEPVKTDCQRELADVCNVLGNIRREQGEEASAAESYDRGRQIFKLLSFEHPTNVDYLSGLSTTIHNLALVENSKGEYTQAWQLLEQSQQYLDKALKLTPQSPKLNSNWSLGLRNQGDTLRKLKRPDEARVYYEKAEKIGRAIFDDNPRVSRFQWLLADTLKAHADFLTSQQKYDEARPIYEESCKILDELTSTESESVEGRPVYGVALLDSLRKLATFRRRTPSEFKAATEVPEDYLTALQHAMRAGERLVQKFPEERKLNYQFALVLSERAQASADLKRDADALRQFQKCVQIFHDVVIAPRFPADENYLREFLMWSVEAADCALRLNKPDEAMRIIDLASASAKDCKGREARSSLANLIKKRAKIHSDAGDDRAAVADYRQSLELTEPALEQAPWHWYVRESVGGAYFQLAETYRRLSEPQGEVDALRAYLRVWGGPVAGLKVDEFLNTSKPLTPDELRQLRELVKGATNMKRFTVPVDFDGLKYPIYLYITNVPWPKDPLEDQAKWLKDERGGTIPEEVRESFRKLHKIAHENNVSFQELCVYALASSSRNSQFQGTWAVTRYVYDGEDLTRRAPFQSMTIGENNAFTLLDDIGTHHEGTLKIDGEKAPYTLTWTWKRAGQAFPSAGLITIEDKTLTLCCDIGGTNPPQAMASKEGSHHILLTFERK